jgi:predicted RNase H-like HicB family nuclease
MRPSKVLERIMDGDHDASVVFNDLVNLLLALGFHERVRGSHHIFTRYDIPEILNLQPKGSSLAKAYQGQAGSSDDKLASSGVERMSRYELLIWWSEEDQAYLVEVPELPGCMADGASYEEAARNAQMVIDEWIATARELGRDIPEPRRRTLSA